MKQDGARGSFIKRLQKTILLLGIMVSLNFYLYANIYSKEFGTKESYYKYNYQSCGTVDKVHIFR